MTSLADLRKHAETFLVQCPACDAGLPMACSCPTGDMRSVIQDLLKALDEVQPLSGWTEVTSVSDGDARVFVWNKP